MKGTSVGARVGEAAVAASSSAAAVHVSLIFCFASAAASTAASQVSRCSPRGLRWRQWQRLWCHGMAGHVAEQSGEGNEMEICSFLLCSSFYYSLFPLSVCEAVFRCLL